MRFFSISTRCRKPFRRGETATGQAFWEDRGDRPRPRRAGRRQGSGQRDLVRRRPKARECRSLGGRYRRGRGTSWSEVEAFRRTDPFAARVAHSFAGWGIPTARALVDVVDAVPGVPVFASGGIRSGIDAAKAIRLGASLVCMAAPMLGTSVCTAGATAETMKAAIEELRIAMFCTGSPTLARLRKAVLLKAADGHQA